jgi:hypothetical protein
MGASAEQKLMEKMGLEVEKLDSGCCGMAGAFGYEPGDKYEVSMAAGERVLLPRVREAEADAVVIADGFSCRSQIEDATERRGLHLAEVLQLALHAERAAGRPEDAHRALAPAALIEATPGQRAAAALLAVGLGVAAFFGARALARPAVRALAPALRGPASSRRRAPALVPRALRA